MPDRLKSLGVAQASILLHDVAFGAGIKHQADQP